MACFEMMNEITKDKSEERMEHNANEIGKKEGKK
jgi:hypothetical protein